MKTTGAHPPLFAALNQPLGLKLELRKRAADLFAIDPVASTRTIDLLPE